MKCIQKSLTNKFFRTFHRKITAGFILSLFLFIHISESQAQNTAPVFTSTPITTIIDTQTYSYMVTASDIDSNTFNFTAPVLPPWLTFSNDNPVSTFLSVGAKSIAIGPSGDFFVSHSELHQILKISPEGVVTTFAGSGIPGYVNGAGSSAQFNLPYGIAVDASGNVYVSSQENHSIRKILPDGTVSTLAGSLSGTSGFLDSIGTNTLFKSPSGISVDAEGNVYVADFGNNKIRKILPDGTTTTLAGSEYGFADGQDASAKFKGPYSVEVDGTGNVFVADPWNHRIRKITPGGMVSTLAGNGNAGFVDGVKDIAEFQHPWGLTLDASGSVYVADFSNNAIRKISPDGFTQTLAGTGEYGLNNGPGSTAIFGNMYDVAVDNAGNLFVADRGNSEIRKIETYPKLTGNPMDHVGEHVVQLKVTDSNGAFALQDFIISVSASGPATGISPVDIFNNIALYPNPSSGKVTISTRLAGTNNATVAIYNMLGQIIQIQRINQNQTTLNLENQPNGMYYINVATGGKETVKKLVLSR